MTLARRNQVYSSVTPTLAMLCWRERHIVNQAYGRFHFTWLLLCCLDVSYLDLGRKLKQGLFLNY